MKVNIEVCLFCEVVKVVGEVDKVVFGGIGDLFGKIFKLKLFLVLRLGKFNCFKIFFLVVWEVSIGLVDFFDIVCFVCLLCEFWLCLGEGKFCVMGFVEVGVELLFFLLFDSFGLFFLF